MIKKAKLTSKRRGKSLSKMVEEHFIALNEKEANRSFSNSLAGILKNKLPANTDLKKSKGIYLKSKHGL